MEGHYEIEKCLKNVVFRIKRGSQRAKMAQSDRLALYHDRDSIVFVRTLDSVANLHLGVYLIVPKFVNSHGNVVNQRNLKKYIEGYSYRRRHKLPKSSQILLISDEN